MLTDFAWNIFEHTGNIDSYIFFSELKERTRAVDERILADAEAATGKNPA